MGNVIAEVRRRVAGYRKTGDPALVLDTSIHEQVRELHRDLVGRPGGGVDVAALVLVARWYLYRYQATPAAYGHADLRAAHAITMLVRDIDPNAVPTELAGLVRAQGAVVPAPDMAMRLVWRYQTHGDVAAAEQARKLLLDAARSAGPGDPALPSSLTNLAFVQTVQFMVNDGVADVDEAVRLARNAVTAAGGDHAARGSALTTLCTALCIRTQRTGNQGDLAEAIRLGHQAVATATSPMTKAQGLDCLCKALWIRYERTGRLADLDEAIGFGRQALTLIPREHPFYSVCLSSLGICLTRRAQRLGSMADGDEIFRLTAELLDMVPPDDPDRCVGLAIRALSLLIHYARFGVPDDLDDAVRASEEAVAASRRYGGHQHWILSNHGLVLFLRYLETGNAADAADAISSTRGAIAATSPDDPRRSFHGRQLAKMLLAKGDQTEDTSDVDEAMELGRTAVATISPGHPGRADALTTLADAYHRRFRVTNDPADLDAAAGLWRSAVGSRVSTVEARMTAARQWFQAAAAANHVPFAAEARAAAVGLLPILAWRGLDRATQERRLAGYAGFASEGAALALHNGQPERAVELLEQGRSVLWSQALQTRTDLSELRDVAPDLADRLTAVRLALDAGQSFTPPDGDGGGQDEHVAGRARRLAERWDSLVREARGLPGFEHFLDAAPFDHLRQAAVGGPVAIINVSSLRCDALLVAPDGVRVVPLPWLAPDAVRDRATVLLAAQREAEADRGTVAGTHFRQTLTSLLRWLWDTIAEPVLEAADDLLHGSSHGTPPSEDGLLRSAGGMASSEGGVPPRIWWCPTGPLTLLPLHAAGRHGGSAVWRHGRGPTVLDQVVSSYTTGLAALIRARGRPAGAAKVLAIGMPETAGMSALPGVREELRRIGAAVPDAVALVGADATAERVLRALRGHSWVHFACHGTQDIQRPSGGAIHLADGPVTVLRLAGHVLSDAEFAYLSACHTATGSLALADEAIHLMAALQMAGFRHVVGTQWSVGDESAVGVSSAVYGELGGGGRPEAGGAAMALWRAVVRLREERLDRPDVWAPYVHSGP
jgi:hypothetical protein